MRYYIQSYQEILDIENLIINFKELHNLEK